MKKGINDLVQELEEVHRKNLISYYNIINRNYYRNETIKTCYVSIHFHYEMDKNIVEKLGKYIEKNFNIHKISTSQNKMIMWVDFV